jgi:hypothetical protein
MTKSGISLIKIFCFPGFFSLPDPRFPDVSRPVMASGPFRYGWLFFPLFLRDFFGTASEILRELSKKSRRNLAEIPKPYRIHPEAGSQKNYRPGGLKKSLFGENLYKAYTRLIYPGPA